MIQVYPVRPDKRDVIPAVTHVDGSGRLQTVNRNANPRYWQLIKAFEALTGVPVVLNTSFNENEPIVHRPEEALDCFLRTEMDVLVMGKWVVEKRGGEKAGRLGGEKAGMQTNNEQKRDHDRWRNLEVWRLADEFAHAIYGATKAFPADELYALTSQLRRAGLSIPTNIVEGYSRGGDKELGRFLDIALGSLGETKYLLHFAATLGYLSSDQQENLQEKACELGRKLWRFYATVKGKTGKKQEARKLGG